MSIAFSADGKTNYHTQRVLTKRRMYSTFFDEKEKQWTGLSRVPFYNSNLSVGQAILHSLELNPSKIAQVILLSSLMLKLPALWIIIISDQRQQWNDANE